MSAFIFQAKADTRHYAFEAYGNSEDEALAALRSGWRAHCKALKGLAHDLMTASQFMDDCMEGVRAIPTRGEVKPCAFRDHDLIWEAGK